MNESLSRYFSRCGDFYVLGSKLEDDTADRSQVITVKLSAQSDEQLNLLFVEGLSIGQIIIPDPDSSTISATNGFNGARASERHNVPPNCHLGNIELTRQAVICIMPSKT